MQMAFDALLRRFLTELFGHLGPRCFGNGVIVAEVGGSDSPMRLFIEGVVARSSARVIARTHRLFMDPAAFDRQRVCGRAPGAGCESAGLVATDQQMEYSFDPKLMVSCAASETETAPAGKGVLLLYRFSYQHERVRRDYAFLKLEADKGLSVAHAISAFQHYVLHSSVEGRRETDKQIDGLAEEAAADALQVQRSCSRLRCKRAEQRDAARASSQYDAQVRVGHEFFVPAALSNAVLDTVVP
jgi:hypothetical protein